MAISPELLLAQTPHDIALNQFATKLSRQTIPFLEDAARFVRRRLNNSDWEEIVSDKQFRRFRAIQRDVEAQLSEIYGRMDDMLFSEFEPLSHMEGDFTVSSINEVLEPDFIMLPVEDQKLWAAVNDTPLIPIVKDGPVDFSKYVEGFGKGTIERINNTIATGYSQGFTLSEITREVVGTKKLNFKDGILGKTIDNADAMIRTSINHIATQSRLRVYSQNKRIVEGYRIVATLDSRTSDICKGYDQFVVMNDDTFKPYPPFHPRCRSSVIPEIKDKALEDSKGTRAANFKAQGDVKAGKVGQVPATTQYYDLLKQQSAAQQDLALGPARGKIFRNAGLSIPEFRKAMVDQMNQPITLSEMAAKNKKILEYMQSNKLSRYLDD